MIHVDPWWAYFAMLMIGAFVVSIGLMVKSSREFSQEEVAKTADDFAGVVRDAHGPITSFLWACYMVMVLWVIAYLWQHSSEFFSLYY